MSRPIERLRGEGCISDLRFDRWLAGDLDDGEARALEEHLAGCAPCRTRRAEIEDARRAFDIPFETPAAKVSSPRRARALFYVGGALALAAAAALLVRPDDTAFRTKGRQRFGFYVLHEGAVRPGGAGEELMPGDRIRFVARSDAPRFIGVLSRDGAGRATVYHPAADRAAPLPAGEEEAFESSVVLDDTLGEESLHALFCEQAVPLEPVRLELEIKGAAFRPPPGCTQETLVVRKVPRR